MPPISPTTPGAGSTDVVTPFADLFSGSTFGSTGTTGSTTTTGIGSTLGSLTGISLAPSALLNPAPTTTPATSPTTTVAPTVVQPNRTTTVSPSISLDTASGNSTPVTVSPTPATGAANASSDAATNAAAKKMLDGVDAELASRLGSKYQAPTNQKERVALVAQVANSLSGAEKTAFLNKIGGLGKEFGVNFGQPSLVTSSANLTTAQKEIQAALYSEFQTGKAFTKGGSTPAASPTTPSVAPTSTTGVASSGRRQSAEVQDLLASIRAENRDQTRARIASWEYSANNTGDNRISDTEMAQASTKGGGTNVGEWIRRDLGLSRPTIDELTDRLRTEARAS